MEMPIGVHVEDREVGRHRGDEAGPTLIAVAGIHGNEPAGLEAAQRVFARLAKGDLRFRGELVVFAGNLRGLRRGVRYHERDLNRAWTEERVAGLLSKPAADWDTEDHEQSELLHAIEETAARARGQIFLADFHTTSAAGIPFILFGDTLRQRHFAQVFPLPILLGLEEQLDGILTGFWTRRGFVTFALEGGQHKAADSVDAIEAVLWLAISRAGLLLDKPAELQRSAELLDKRRGTLPRVVEVVSRRSITPEDSFVMEPGFRNIDHARKGQLLARDIGGEIRANEDGLVVLPLYQGLGGDGYFWGREMSAARLRASGLLRLSGARRLLGLLPGVRRDGARFVVKADAAKTLEVLQLFGYRHVRPQGAELLVERCGA
jgi:Succinylglutamate desuccinylase / Aspartoacylase family